METTITFIILGPLAIMALFGRTSAMRVAIGAMTSTTTMKGQFIVFFVVPLTIDIGRMW